MLVSLPRVTPALSDVISASVLQRETVVCSSETHDIGTTVRLPDVHSAPFDVDLKSTKFLAKTPSLECTKRSNHLLFFLVTNMAMLVCNLQYDVCVSACNTGCFGGQVLF